MKIGDEVRVITQESYNGHWFGVVGKVEKIWPDNPECPYPYEVSFGDASGTWPFSEEEIKVIK